MHRSIAWMTFVLAMAVAADLYRQESFDQGARNLAATSERRTEIVERSLQTIDDANIGNLKDIANRKMRNRIGEH